MLRPLKRLYHALINIYALIVNVQKLVLELVYQHRLEKHPNMFARRFASHYTSQSDEDGLTIEILRRIGLLDFGNFLEIGVGNGTENNTLILLMHGWHGAWIGCEDIHIELPNNLLFIKSWVTLTNLESLIERVIDRLESIDLLSIDTDGNDIYFLEFILKTIHIKPKVIICEYNAFMPPTVSWAMKYQPDFNWKQSQKRDVYFGASLLAFKQLLEFYDYTLIACNPHTGANAFFVHNTYSNLFKDCPEDIRDIYVNPFYTFNNKFGYSFSSKILKPNIIKSNFIPPHY